MSRKAFASEEDKAQWSTIKQWTMSRGYSAYRAQDTVPEGTLVVLTHLQSTSEHPLMDAAPLLRPLLSGDVTSAFPMPPLVLVMDLSGLAPDDETMVALLDTEGQTPDFSKGPKKAKGKAKGLAAKDRTSRATPSSTSARLWRAG